MGFQVHKRHVVVALGTCGETDCGWTYGDLDTSDFEVERAVQEHRRWHSKKYQREMEALDESDA